MTSASDIPDRPGQPIADAFGVSSADVLAGAERVSRTLRQLACEHPDRVNTRTLADPADTWHCPACGADWRDEP